MSTPIVFFDIAGPDSAALGAFYKSIFGWRAGKDVNFNVKVTSPIDATIRQDPAEKILYLGVSDITATLERIVEAGGSQDTPRFEVPGVVVLGLFKDPAGNRMGLVEMNGDQPKIP